MENSVVNICEKFHNDRLRNDRALGNGKSENSKNKKTATRRTTFVELGDPAVPGSNNLMFCDIVHFSLSC